MKLVNGFNQWYVYFAKIWSATYNCGTINCKIKLILVESNVTLHLTDHLLTSVAFVNIKP
jgi:hypothetical protein